MLTIVIHANLCNVISGIRYVDCCNFVPFSCVVNLPVNVNLGTELHARVQTNRQTNIQNQVVVTHPTPTLCGTKVRVQKLYHRGNVSVHLVIGCKAMGGAALMPFPLERKMLSTAYQSYVM